MPDKHDELIDRVVDEIGSDLQTKFEDFFAQCRQRFTQRVERGWNPISEPRELGAIEPKGSIGAKYLFGFLDTYTDDRLAELVVQAVGDELRLVDENGRVVACAYLS